MRIACLDLPAFPLQLVQRDHPEWRGRAVVVIDQDSPRGVVLWANERARKVGILPGLAYAGGLSLDADLRAEVVPPESIATAIDAITKILQTLSPTVEPSPADEDPGVFWIDAGGLSLIHPSLADWATAVRAAIERIGLRGAIAVGHTRFGSYATARALVGRGQILWDSADEEARAAAQVPLTRVGIDPQARAQLARLGVHTVGQLASLPEAGLLRRYGREVHRLHRRACFTVEEPLTPARAEEPLRLTLDFDDAIADEEALVFFTKQLLDPLLARLAKRGEALASLTLHLDSASPREETLTPAVPTLEVLQLLNLVRLRLERTKLEAGVRALTVTVVGHPATREQLALFLDAQPPRRDRKAGDRALARLRASLGDDAVVHAVPAQGHLPEARYTWQPMQKLVEPKPKNMLIRPLVRRLRSRPEPLPARPAREPDGWLLRGIAYGPVARVTGPFRLSGGWWRSEIRRDYYYAELERGDLCWIYYDQVRRRWYLHGEVA